MFKWHGSHHLFSHMNIPTTVFLSLHIMTSAIIAYRPLFMLYATMNGIYFHTLCEQRQNLILFKV